ncbi:MAG: hypothetical protein H6739_26040 [Alphaproteobacteria bacterium]|nr:hypothetical protein [Alphaproteobacteria bacterium]
MRPWRTGTNRRVRPGDVVEVEVVTVDRATGRVTLKSTPRSFTPYRHRPPLLVEDGALALPRPPAQGSPWTPPQAAGPAPLVDATRTLLAQGLADPRGCEYREIVVGYGTVWDEGERRLITRGWVLPCERAAVTWSGLVHPLLAVGEAADLATDVEGLHRQLERQRAAFEEKTGGAFSLRRFERSGEHERLWSSSCHPLKAALLLAAGEADLARAVWASWVAALDLEVNGNAEAVARPYRTLAEDWGWALFDRAVCAHARGDDPLALTSARAAAEVCARVEDELRRRGFRDPALRFAPSLPPLLADQERRASLTRDASVPPLIAELEEASVLQGGQPGWPALEGAPQVQALIQAGTEALEDLVRCLRSDRRLTRSVRFWRAHQPERSALSVAEAAYVAIREILQVDFLQGDETLRSLDEPGFREALADRVTAFRERYGDLQGAALQAQILADDAADPSLWCAAVRHLSRPDGDALRDRTGIARHMARRAREMADAGGFPDHLRPAVGIGLALASWDRAAAAPVLRDLWARARAIEVSEDEQRPRAEALAELTVARALRRRGGPRGLRRMVPGAAQPGSPQQPAAVPEPAVELPGRARAAAPGRLGLRYARLPVAALLPEAGASLSAGPPPAAGLPGRGGSAVRAGRAGRHHAGRRRPDRGDQPEHPAAAPARPAFHGAGQDRGRPAIRK